MLDTVSSALSALYSADNAAALSGSSGLLHAPPDYRVQEQGSPVRLGAQGVDIDDLPGHLQTRNVTYGKFGTSPPDPLR
ncbi:hypothetical protein BDW66DRAFT_130634 [Aspergillus desertorum]